MQRWPIDDPGDYIHQIAIMKPVDNPDGAAGPETSWEKFASCYAAIDPATARDVMRGGQTTSQVEIPIRMHWMAGVTSNMQVWRPSGEKYVIQGILNARELNVRLTLMCVALGANQ